MQSNAQYMDSGAGQTQIAGTSSSSTAVSGGATLGAAATLNPYVIAGAAAFQIWSGIQDAEAIREQAKLTARINEINAHYAEIDAWEAEKFGQTQVARYEKEVDQTVGDQRSNLAAAGVDVNFGSAKEIQDETRLTGFLNTLDIQNTARAKALGFRREARQIRMNGGMRSSESELNANAAQNAGVLNAVSTGISGYSRK